MGLDVYLYKFDDFAKTKVKEKRYATLSEQILRQELSRLGKISSDDLSRDERNDIYQKTISAAALEELMDTVEERDRHQVENDSQIYPDHLFKIGYFRSNPTSGGLNNILRDRVGKSLYYIFTGDEKKSPTYEFKPDWAESLRRSREVLAEFKTYVDKHGNFGVAKVPLRDAAAKTEREALDSFNKLRQSASLPKSSYYLERPLDVHAVIPGEDAVFLIHERKTSFEWYFEALEIVTETCEWVLSRPAHERERMYLIWSD